ncbi:phage tail sheath family protein [Pararhizobium sp. BT-229]|uniref:phage tail sheath family protein n=1 Tax=Pararhizobium sp. BT-229 TaxID=2986923 RepID=UPI0021F7CC92|nr:phage tail sheath family protein [Pararhizobium sp. BT-229]MCV9961739.1 phage tail sheath family protein [Pararhizobium sp. BT-229]
MPEYLAPGVFIEEIERGPRPIEGVPTSTAAFLGETERGPITPRLVSSYIEYKRWFGDVFGNRDRYMPYAASGFFENGGRRLFVCRIVGEQATTASIEFDNFRVSAVGAGEWGKRIFAKIEAGTTESVPPGEADKRPVGFRLRVAYWAKFPDGFQIYDPFLEVNRPMLPRPSAIEDWDDLSVEPNSPDYFEKRLTGNSALVTVDRIDDTNSDLPAANAGALLENGADAPEILSDDYVGEPVIGQRDDAQGLYALTLDPYREVALVHAPYFPPAQDLVSKAVVSHCERMRFRFAVLDTDVNALDFATVDPRTTVVESQYAAVYYPWLQVSDPQSGALKYVPPGGYALGIYARTDVERGVFKAPANETVRGAVKLRIDINDQAQEVLNPRGVNAIRSFPGRGIRVWGARTLSANGLWKYVSVRRLFIFLERSIYEGTQWVVFEPNDDRLWARVTDTLRLFLRSQWRNGALFGRTEKEAFFITCDRTTMTQDDILNGRLICEIGIAPVRPAEFVVFRIFQHTAESQR